MATITVLADMSTAPTAGVSRIPHVASTPAASGTNQIAMFSTTATTAAVIVDSDGAEAIMALRGLWLSEDGRWDHYWLCPGPRARTA